MKYLSEKPRYFIRDIQDEMSRMIENVLEDFGIGEQRRIDTERFWTPAIELLEQDNSYELKAQLPGMTKDNIDIEISDNQIKIKGELKEEIKEESENLYRSEFRYGKFLRTVQLPSNVKEDEAKAEFKDGLLKINIPKTEERKKLNKLKIE